MIKLATVLVSALILTACVKPAARLPSGKLDSEIGAHIGDPTTCVLITDRSTGKVLYTYGANFNCVRALPACDRPGTLSARQALGLAAVGRGASCPSAPDGSRSVGWAEGVVAGSTPPLLYSAVMEGEAALPGIEMNTRLAQVFLDTGLTPGKTVTRAAALTADGGAVKPGSLEASASRPGARSSMVRADRS